jgi:aminomethyltransferase
MGTQPQSTVLFSTHQKLGARIVDFHGWQMPIQYSGILAEHQQVRERCGLFDVSHMGEFLLQGPDACASLQHLMTNNVARLEDGQCLYTPMCYENGTVVDDLLVYRYESDRFMVVVNASNIEKDFEWMSSNLKGETKITNLSKEISLIALQGPLSAEVICRVLDPTLLDIAPFRFVEFHATGVPLLISRTGYTGEDGFEIYLRSDSSAQLFERFLEEEEVGPVGLGARDTLRFEAKLPLYGNELSGQITPLDAGLKKFCDLEGEPFIGQEILRKQSENKPEWKLCGLEMIEKGIPRTGFSIYKEENSEFPIGCVTSGSFCPTLDKNCALALVQRTAARVGDEIYIEIRSSRRLARVVKTPFYRRS